LIETHTYRGLWWTPSDPDEKLNGTLTITKGEPILELVGHFGRRLLSASKTERAYSLDLADQERILGLTTDGKDVTLVDCSEAPVGNTISFPGIEVGAYRARVAIFGHAFGEGDPIEFNAVEIRASELEKWVGYTPFPVKRHEERRGAVIDFALPDDMEFRLTNGDQATLKFEMRTDGLGVVTTEATLRFTAWLGLRFVERRDLAGVTSAVWRLRNFLSLALGRTQTILAVDAYRDDLVDRTGHRITLHLFYGIPFNPEPPKRGTLPWEILFTFGRVREHLGATLTAWLEHHDLYEPVFGLYFGTLYNPSTYREQRFLAYAQAIETYDRLKRPKARRRPKDEHKAMLAEIYAGVPVEHHDWLKRELAWSNDLILAQRIEYVLSVCPNVAEQIVGTDENPMTKLKTVAETSETAAEAFVRLAKDTRNYYTHYDPDLKRKAATEPADMHRLTVQLRAVLETAFLLDLGFPCDEIEDALKRARRVEEIGLNR
jgi:hypothetical protein